MAVKPLHKKYADAMGILSYQFTNRHGEIMDTYKIQIHSVTIGHHFSKGGNVKDITEDVRMCHAKKTMSVFLSFDGFPRKPFAFKVTIKYSYRNNPKVFTFNETLKYIPYDFVDRRNKQRDKRYKKKRRNSKQIRNEIQNDTGSYIPF